MESTVNETRGTAPEPSTTTPTTDTHSPKGAATDKQSPRSGAQVRARKRIRVAQGVYRDRHGLAATVKVNGVQREIRFPPGTPLKMPAATSNRLNTRS